MSAPTVTTDVTTAPQRFCKTIGKRRALARRPPEIGYMLRNNDVDNFSGKSSLECNERQMLFWGPAAPSPNLDRPAVYVRFTFLEDDEALVRFVRESTPTEDFARLRDGTQVRVYATPGQAAGRFAIDNTIVDVRVACADQTGQQTTVRCRRPALSPEFLRARLLRTLSRLEPQLRARLGSGGRLPAAPGD